MGDLSGRTQARHGSLDAHWPLLRRPWRQAFRLHRRAFASLSGVGAGMHDGATGPDVVEAQQQVRRRDRADGRRQRCVSPGTRRSADGSGTGRHARRDRRAGRAGDVAAGGTRCSRTTTRRGRRRRFPARSAPASTRRAHGIPDATALHDGDLVSIDYGAPRRLVRRHGDQLRRRHGQPRRRPAGRRSRGRARPPASPPQPGNTLGDIGFAIANVARVAAGLLAHPVSTGSAPRSHRDARSVSNEGIPGHGAKLSPGWCWHSSRC